MAITKAKKKEILDKLQDITNKESVVFVNFHGLPVTETSAMRGELRQADVRYFVTKKTLVKKAFEGSKLAGELPAMEGELALAYADDLTAPAREIFKFQKKHAGNISILGGTFEGRFLNKKEMEEIAQIPSLHTLQGMFVNVINAPIQGFVVALQAIADKKSA